MKKLVTPYIACRAEKKKVNASQFYKYNFQKLASRASENLSTTWWVFIFGYNLQVYIMSLCEINRSMYSILLLKYVAIILSFPGCLSHWNIGHVMNIIMKVQQMLSEYFSHLYSWKYSFCSFSFILVILIYIVIWCTVISSKEHWIN